MAIHPSSIVHSSAQIGKDVEIGPYVIIGPDVKLGDGCRIHSHAVIEYTELGEGCEVFPQVSLGLAPQHLGYKGEPTRLVVGARCVFRESVTVHRGTPIDRSVTSIGNNGYFMAFSHIAHDCVVGDNVIMANGAQLAGHVKVADRCFISALAGIHQWTRIGMLAIVSGGSMVPMDVVPFAMVQGDRARIVGLNTIGMRRAGVDRESFKLIKAAYRTLFRSGLPLAEALDHVTLNHENKNILAIKEFCLASKRGILRPDELAGYSEEIVAE